MTTLQKVVRMLVTMCSAVAMLVASNGPILAGDAAVKAFQDAAYNGRFADGADKLAAMLRSDADDVEAVFGLGAMQFFGAIADLQKGVRAHTTAMAQSGLTGGGPAAMVLLPMGQILGDLALVPPNSNATPMTYAKLRDLLAAFSASMANAEQTLALVGDRAVKLPFRPFDIAIDLDQNGSIEEHERILVSLLGRGRQMRQDLFAEELAFDTADASWLRGYANLLLATVNFMLAFDFERAYAVGAHNLYGDSATAFGAELARQAGLVRAPDEVQAELDKVLEDIDTISRDTSNAKDIRDLQQQIAELEVTPGKAETRRLLQEALQNMVANQTKHRDELNRLYAEQRRLSNQLYGTGQGWIYDAIAFVHTLSFKVVEAKRLEAARLHLLQVMTLNQNTWRLVRAETDNDREWLPNAKQTAPFGSSPVTDEVIDSWLATTALAADVLEGRKLLPHPRFTKGFNLRKLLQSAQHIDFVLLATGHDLVPYLEEGPMADAEAWSAITQPMGRDVGGYALWFN